MCVRFVVYFVRSFFVIDLNLNLILIKIGTKCTSTIAITNSPTNAPVVNSNSCLGICKGEYPFGCNPSFAYGYCNSGGGCSYTQTNTADWCCFKGCPVGEIVTNSQTNAPTNAPTKPTTIPETSTICNNGCHYFLDTDIAGENFQIVQTSNQNTCCSACNANSGCKSWVVLGSSCYLKTGTERVFKAGCVSGLLFILLEGFL